MNKLILLFTITILSCGKQETYENWNTDRRTKIIKDKYQLFIDFYNKDTTRLIRRHLYYQDFFSKEKTWGMDTIPDQVFRICNIDTLIEHQYYLVNNKRLFENKINKTLVPAFADTNWINYHTQ